VDAPERVDGIRPRPPVRMALRDRERSRALETGTRALDVAPSLTLEEPAPLPDRVVRVADGKRGEPWLPTLPERAVALVDLETEQVGGVRIVDAEVPRHDEEMLV